MLQDIRREDFPEFGPQGCVLIVSSSQQVHLVTETASTELGLAPAREAPQTHPEQRRTEISGPYPTIGPDSPQLGTRRDGLPSW